MVREEASYSVTVASRSTDKLGLLCAALVSVPEETLSRVEEFSLEWKTIDDSQTLLPFVKVKFK